MSKYEDFEKFSLSLPADMLDILREKAADRRLPISRLIWYALDNEMDSQEPFNYDCPKPETVFVQYSYTEEAKRIFEFLKRYPEGLNVDMIMLMRRRIGIPNKTILMLAIRELLATGMAVESRVAPKGKFFKDLHPDLTWIRLSRDTAEAIDKDRKALEIKKAKLQQKENRLDYKDSLIKGDVNAPKKS